MSWIIYKSYQDDLLQDAWVQPFALVPDFCYGMSYSNQDSLYRYISMRKYI